MARDSNGSHTLPSGNPVVTDTTISSATHNATMEDLSDEITDSLSRSGKGGMSADLDMGGFNITDLAAPVALTDASTKEYVETYVNTATSDRAMGGFKITGLGAPTADTDASTKKYADDLLTVNTTATITAGTGWTYGDNYLRKVNSVVSVVMDCVAGGSAAWTAMGTLPTGFRPTHYLYVPCRFVDGTDGNSRMALMTITTEGVLQGYLYDNSTYLVSMPTIGTDDHIFAYVTFLI